MEKTHSFVRKDGSIMTCDSGKDQQPLMEKYGWVGHYVFDDIKCPFETNYHTHGLQENFGHKDIQICVPADQHALHGIANLIVNRIKGGEVFEPGKVYTDILAGGLKTYFIEAKELGRPVLRLILPDKNGEVEGMFKQQLEMLDNQ